MSESQPEKPEEKPEAPAYEPPRVTYLGNLSNLLGKTGTKFDNPNPHQKRP
jgi:hypothetical protein